MNTEYKCRYKNCPYGGTVSNDVAVKDGKSYYHPDCLKEKNNKNQIIDIFYKYINKAEVGAQLRKTVDNIVDTKKSTSEFLLYALCYVIHHKMSLNHPAGLYYIINNDEIKQAYKHYQDSQVQKMDTENIETEKEVSFEIKNTKNKGWESLLE